MAALIPDEKGLVLDGYQFLKEFGLVPSIAEPVSHPHSLLSHHCLAVSLTLTSLNLCSTQPEYIVRILCA